MTQEVQVTLTLEVDTTLSKADIKNEITKIINFATLHSNSYDRMLISMINITEIKEEAELYNNS